jgi:hypothetical protein
MRRSLCVGRGDHHAWLSDSRFRLTPLIRSIAPGWQFLAHRGPEAPHRNVRSWQRLTFHSWRGYYAALLEG